MTTNTLSKPRSSESYSAPQTHHLNKSSRKKEQPKKAQQGAAVQSAQSMHAERSSSHVSRRLSSPATSSKKPHESNSRLGRLTSGTLFKPREPKIGSAQKAIGNIPPHNTDSHSALGAPRQAHASTAQSIASNPYSLYSGYSETPTVSYPATPPNAADPIGFTDKPQNDFDTFSDAPDGGFVAYLNSIFKF